MANTSKEHERMWYYIFFMNQCNKQYNINMKWIEAGFNEKGVGVDFNIVKYEEPKNKR